MPRQTRAHLSVLLLALLLVCPPQALAMGGIHRFVLAAGANSGGPERVPLRYAYSDAAAFLDVMTKMGGVDPSDRLLLRDPDVRKLNAALAELRDRVVAVPDTTGRTEVLFYYSGHADEHGLLLGGDRFSYHDLRQQMDAIAADVRITVLDACASGAITRIKGGQRRQAFLIDDASTTTGYAFLTSSSADEVAQESDQIGSSFFTHYLLSGMRGAADASADGKVSLNEAYEFAFHETLASTTETRGGAQHPAYEISLSGTGDVVMTDVRETSASVLLSEELSGRFFIRGSDRRLVAELYKPAGRTIELGLEPGTYRIYMAQEEDLFLGTSRLEQGERLILRSDNFERTERETTAARGGLPGASMPTWTGLAGRTRLEGGVGMWSPGPKPPEDVTSGIVRVSAGTWNMTDEAGISRWVRDDLSFGIRFASVEMSLSVDVGATVTTESLVVTSVLVGVRKYLPETFLAPPFFPYMSGYVGPYIAALDRSTAGAQVTSTHETRTAFAGQLGVGVDLQLSRHWMLDVKGVVNLVTSFSEPVGGRENYSGLGASAGLSLLLGKGMHPQP
jgi:hypothetical protein